MAEQTVESVPEAEMSSLDTDALIKFAEISNSFAEKAYEEIKRRWDVMERLEPELPRMLKSLNCDFDNNRNESDRWDDVTELRDKLHDGIDVLQEMEDYKINFLDRVKLEGELVKRMQSAREDLVRVLDLKRWKETLRDGSLLEAEHDRLRFLIQHLDRSYFSYYTELLDIYVSE